MSREIDFLAWPRPSVTLEEVAAELHRRGIASGIEDTRRVDLDRGGIDYYGNKFLHVRGLPQICYLELKDMFLERNTCFRFTYAGKYFFREMGIGEIIKFLQEEHDALGGRIVTEPEKRGWWTYHGHNYPRTFYECSYCGHEVLDEVAFYAEKCPHCGAKMDMNDYK